MVEVADLCDIIQVFVSDDTALLEVARTIAAALSPRHLIAAHATVSPTAARQAAAIVESQGARYLDAPFTGSKMAAQNTSNSTTTSAAPWRRWKRHARFWK